ncbi:helix-turn-helix transcriptional regulator [uncultured Dysosmobacter sp.]|uniref:helix-turn-helix domain-containing protein n=1 Tax=uncultured Dysosmobacter sp. TaxID=2591384 RepID=UPI00261E80E7|nr:helix-turn-helix transcriptional regulator [uncultured Dysosmobacter sp.]
MKNNTNLKALLSALTESISDADLLLSAIQGELAATITSARIAKGMSQKDLATALDVTQALVSRWETGDVNFTLKTLVNIALKLGIKMRSPYVSADAPYHVAASGTSYAKTWRRSSSSSNLTWSVQSTSNNYSLMRA